MKPALTTIQKVAKAGKVLSRIVFVLCIVLTCLLVIALVFYAIVGDRRLFNIGGVNIYGLIYQNTGIRISYAMMVTAICSGILICAAEIVLSQFAVTYFKHELQDGTPFTYHGAKELKRLGFLAMFIPLGVDLVCGIAMAVVTTATMPPLPGNTANSLRVTVGTGGSFGIGIAMLIVSAFCRHGAQMEESGQWNAARQWNDGQGYANQQQYWSQQSGQPYANSPQQNYGASQQWNGAQQNYGASQQWNGAQQNYGASQQWNGAQQNYGASQQWDDAQQNNGASQQWDDAQQNYYGAQSTDGGFAQGQDPRQEDR